MTKVIEVVDTAVFKEKLEMAEAILPYVLSLLKTKKAVSNFLGKSVSTIDNMIKDGRFKEGVHFVYEEKKIKFIPEEIIRWKLNPIKKKISKPKHYISSEAINYV